MKKKNFAFAILIILILIIAVVASYYYENQSNKQIAKSDFNLSLSSLNGTVVQGESIQVKLNITHVSGKSLNVALSAIANSSDLEFNFEPAENTLNSINDLTINASNSTPSNYYMVNITANNGEVSKTVSYTLGVLNAYVTVSGKVEMYTGYEDGYLTSIVFRNNQTKTDQVVNFPFISNQNLASDYSINLQNEQTYSIVVNYYQGYASLSQWFSAGYYGGTLTIFAPVGNTTITGLNLTNRE